MLALLDRSAHEQAPAAVRFSLLVLEAAPGAANDAGRQSMANAMCERLKVPADFRELAQLAVRAADAVQQSCNASAPELLSLLEMCDTLRRPDRFESLLQVCGLDAQSQASGTQGTRQFNHLRMAAQVRAEIAALGLSEKALTEGLRGPAVGAYLRSATLQAISEKIRNH